MARDFQHRNYSIITTYLLVDTGELINIHELINTGEDSSASNFLQHANPNSICHWDNYERGEDVGDTRVL